MSCATFLHGEAAYANASGLKARTFWFFVAFTHLPASHYYSDYKHRNTSALTILQYPSNLYHVHVVYGE